MYGLAASVDIRHYPKYEKGSTIGTALNNLKHGELMELINDNDPKPLYPFVKDLPKLFVCDYIEQGPEVWRVIVEKR